MALKLVFIGYNEEQTRRYFEEFKEANQDQIFAYAPHQGEIWMKDGTYVYRAGSDVSWAIGRRFDQIIMACDRRGTSCWPEKRYRLLDELISRLSVNQVRMEDRIIIYELDEKEGRP